MKIWTITGFNGHWPVGTSAVVIADSRELAAYILEEKLGAIGLSQVIDPKDLEFLPIDHPQAVVLTDGDY